MPELPDHDTTATLLVSCPDRPGLVAALAQALYGVGANILDADQHTDPLAGEFFQRIHFDVSDVNAAGSASAFEAARRAVEEAGRLNDMRLRFCQKGARKRVAILVSRTDHCLYDLLLRHRAGELDCEIALIISNHDSLAPVAADFGIPYHVHPVTKETKSSVETEEIALLESERIDLIVLARYMQILSDEFIGHFPARIINIHHSFLPAFAGGRPYHQAHERGVKQIGATAHYATADLDEGPIIEQDVIRVSHRDLPADLVRKGRDVERTVLSRAVRLHLEDRILVYGNRTVVFE